MSTTNENKTTYDNIKLLSNLNKQNEMPELIKNIKDSKKHIDVILKQLKEREKEFAQEAQAQSVAQQDSDSVESSAIPKINEINSNNTIDENTTAIAESPFKSSDIEALSPSVLNDSSKEKEKNMNITDNVTGLKEEKVASKPTQATKSESKKSENTASVYAQSGLKAEPASVTTSETKQELKTDSKTTVSSTASPATSSADASAATASSSPASAQAAAKPVKKAKTAEDRFKESLPKPIKMENRRFIDLTPEKPKTERYTNPRPEGGQRPYNNYGNSGNTNRGFGNNNYNNNTSNNFGNRPPRQPGPNQGAGMQPGFKKDFGDSGNSFANRGNAAKRPLLRPGAIAPAPIEFPKDTKGTVKKKVPEKTFDSDKKAMNKRTLIRKGFEVDVTLMSEDNVKMGSRKYKTKKKDERKPQPVIIEKAVVNTEIIQIKTLSEKLGITAAEITKKLFKDGIIKTINESIDFETAALLAADLGIELELKLDRTAEDTLAEIHIDEEQDDVNMVKRPPIITVMGHVDHGKTSLLDAIKSTNVVLGEAGGITQHIGAYTITINNEKITFIDTPGHEAFTAMRARGASVTDIAILVVAADDGIMPQTIEAINHAKAADVPIIVAINKMDKNTADPDRIKQQLTEHGIVPEEWGGDTIICPVSAKSRQGIEHLLEMVLLLAEVKDLKANPNRKAKGTIIEAKLDKGKGPVASILVQNGTLKIGDTVVAGTTSGRIRAMLDDKGKNIKEAGPSIAVSILGFSDVPNAGDAMFVMEDEKISRQVAEERMNKLRTNMVKSSSKVTLDDVFGKIAEGQIKGLNIIIKADVQGSVEAVKQALEKMSTAEIKVNIIHGGVGAISESDVTLAQTASAIIIGFNVRPDANAKQLSERNDVDIRLYRIIYEVTDAVQKALKGMLDPKYKEVVLGQAQVRNVFKITGVGVVAGSYVTSGKIVRNAKVRLLRDNVVITEGQISSLKRFKDDAKEVAQGYECGISLDGYNDIKEGDVFECYNMEVIES